MTNKTNANMACFVVGDWVDNGKDIVKFGLSVVAPCPGNAFFEEIYAEIDQILDIKGVGLVYDEKPKKPRATTAEKPKKRPASKKPVVRKRVRSVPKKD